VLRLSPRRLAALCLAILGASALGHLVAAFVHVGTDLVFSLTPSRLDGLVLGSWLAVRQRAVGAERARPYLYRRLLAAAGAVGLLLVFPARGLPVGHPWVAGAGLSGLAVVFTLLLAGLLASPATAVGRRFFELRPLRYLGRISYGFYIVHVPIVAALRSHWPPPDGSLRDCVAFFAAALLISGAAASVTWFVVERPLLHLGRARRSVALDTGP
jgi:peptidoglycan/LPS O-acetylase OafA/YrhL